MFGLYPWRGGEIGDLKRIHKFLREYLEDFIAIEDKVPKVQFEVTRFLLEENIEIYDSVIQLRKKGRFLTCLILARSVLENSINLQYIYRQDTERRARNFHLYPLREYVRRSEERGPLSQKHVELVKKMTEELKAYAPSGDSKYYWDGKSISKIFTELNLKPLYGNLYGRLSAFTHSKFMGRDFNQDRPYINFLREVLVKDIFLVMLETVKVISERFDMESALVVVNDYPPGMDTVFYTNPKKVEKEMREKGDNPS